MRSALAEDEKVPQEVAASAHHAREVMPPPIMGSFACVAKTSQINDEKVTNARAEISRLAGLCFGKFTMTAFYDAFTYARLLTTADAAGTAGLALPAGLPASVYLVRNGQQVRRLVVE